jgi:hypothetical protein
MILTPLITAFWESLTRPLIVARNSCDINVAPSKNDTIIILFIRTLCFHPHKTD